MQRRQRWLAVALLLLGTAAAAQTPQPFPRPGEPSRPQPTAPPPSPRGPDTKGLKVLPPETAPAEAPLPPAPGEPNEKTLGVPIYPGAQFIASYDAGRGQQYYLFGINSDFAQIVAYYRATLKQRGDLVYQTPPIHMFDVGRFREETMAFPPGVTVKDYSPEGYLSLRKAEAPQRFRTIIQIVPPPPPAAVPPK